MPLPINDLMELIFGDEKKSIDKSSQSNTQAEPTTISVPSNEQPNTTIIKNPTPDNISNITNTPISDKNTKIDENDTSSIEKSIYTTLTNQDIPVSQTMCKIIADATQNAILNKNSISKTIFGKLTDKNIRKKQNYNYDEKTIKIIARSIEKSMNEMNSTNNIPSNENNETPIKCTIKRIFNNCPKPGGWYGMFASVRGEDDIRLSGVTQLSLAEGMQIEVYVSPDPKNTKPDQIAYIWKSISVITKTRTGTITYLRTLPGISQAVAKKVVDQFGENTIEMIETDIDTVKSKCKLTEKQANALKEGVSANNIFNKLQKQLPELTKNQIDYCTERLGVPLEKIIDTIKDDPYFLSEIPSVSFTTADTIALRFGIDPMSDYRIACGTKYLLNQDRDNTYINVSNDIEFYPLYKKIVNLLKLPDLDSMTYCQKLMSISSNTTCPVTLIQRNGETHLYMRNILGAIETTINVLKTNIRRHTKYSNGMLPAINKFIADYGRNQNKIANKEQKEAIVNALTNSISIITGGPGRGKTFTIDCIANAWCGLDNVHNYTNYVYLLAPTGKATAKLNDMTNHTFNTTCMTVDKMICKLTYQMQQKAKSKHSPNEINLTPNHLIIIDESSMLDIVKASKLLSLCSSANICFVGDVDQLPPINIGNFFKDVIESHTVPTTVLVTPMRNGGAILSNAEKINNNNPDLSYNFTDMTLMNFPDDSIETQKQIIDQYFSELQKVPNNDPRLIALLCPMRKGETGTVKLNMALQNDIVPINPNVSMTYDARRGRNVYVQKGFEIPNHLYGNKENYTRFRIGDTVINTENNNFIQVVKYSNNDYFNGDPIEQDMGITNGDCGTIIEYVPPTADDHEYIIVKLFDNRIIEIDGSIGDFDSFELGYALTVHKAQGSEYHTVIYVSPLSMRNLTNIGFANKNIVYTAVTRAQKRVVIIGSKDALDATILCSVRKGNTELAEMLQ